MIKKLFLILAICLMASMAWADCTIGVGWTPDPAQTAITEQQVWLNPDGVAENGDEVMKIGALGAAVNQYNWTDTGDCPASATVFVRTLYIGGIQIDSAEVAPQGVVGAIISISVKHQQ